MKKLLHIIATPRGDESRTLAVSQSFLDLFKKTFPDCEVDELNLFAEKLPDITIKMVNGKYALLGGKDLSAELQSAWKEIIAHIDRFLYADMYLISAPMWNFNIPYVLKQYIDIILQPRYLFRYTPQGPEGLVKDKKMLVVTSRGGDYGVESPFHAYDFQEPYLRSVFGFVGISDITFVNAQPMDAAGPDIMKVKLEEAKKEAMKLFAKV